MTTHGRVPPAVRSASSAEMAMTATAGSGAILVADDDPNDLFVIRRRLNKAKITNPVVSFHDGEEIIGFLRPLAAAGEKSLFPAVIFLDIKMPKVDGFEVLRWIRKQRDLKDVPVVMLSGSDEPRDLKRATELGASRYLVKHPPSDVFAKVIAEYCAKR